MDNPIKNDLEKKSSLSQMTEEDYKIMKDIIELIKKSPNSESFKYPVDIKANPNYLRVINFNPMDLSTIEKKLSNQEYSLCHSFQRLNKSGRDYRFYLQI